MAITTVLKTSLELQPFFYFQDRKDGGCMFF